MAIIGLMGPILYYGKGIIEPSFLSPIALRGVFYG